MSMSRPIRLLRPNWLLKIYLPLFLLGCGGLQKNKDSTSVLDTETVSNGNSLTPDAAASPGLKATYFSETWQTLLKRTDLNIDFDWASGSPATEVPADKFIVRWEGDVLIPEAGDYEFILDADDGVKLWVDYKLVIDDWTLAKERKGVLQGLEAGRRYMIKLEFYEHTGLAKAKLSWKRPSGLQEIIPASQFTHNPSAGQGPTPPALEPTPAPGASTLREAAAANRLGKHIGAALSSYMMQERVAHNGTMEPLYATIAAREFDTVVPENELKPQNLQPNRGEWKFDRADQLVDFAAEHKMKVKGHALLMPYDNISPQWMRDITDANELRGVMENHIRTVVRHFKGKIFSWDVVNEAVGRQNHFSRKLGGSTGYEYVAEAFRIARDELDKQGDHDVLLIYNDNAIERDTEATNERVDQMYRMVSDFKSRKPAVPIDGIGFQFHIGPKGVTGAEWKQTVGRFAALGLKVNVSEIDIGLGRTVPKTEDQLKAQALKYFDITKACMEMPECMGVTSWGFTDKHTWLKYYDPDANGLLTPNPNPDPLLFDAKYNKKPAYDAVLKALQLLPYE